MERRFRVRLGELRDDAEVRPGLLRGMAPRREEFLRPFVESLGSAARRRHATEYVRGLLSNLGAKTAEAIAYLHDRERQGLQKFIGQADWDHRPLLAELARHVGEELGDPHPARRGNAGGVNAVDSRRDDCRQRRDDEGDDLPVGNVNFAQAEGSCQKLTAAGRKSGELPKDWEFRLPTEAQWEYASRAGTTTATAFGDKLSNKQAHVKHVPYNGAEVGRRSARRRPGRVPGRDRPHPP